MASHSYVLLTAQVVSIKMGHKELPFSNLFIGYLKEPTLSLDTFCIDIFFLAQTSIPLNGMNVSLALLLFRYP